MFNRCLCLMMFLLITHSKCVIAQTTESVETAEKPSPILEALATIKDLHNQIEALGERAASAEGERLEALHVQMQDKNSRLIAEIQELSLLTSAYVEKGGDLQTLLVTYKTEILNSGRSFRADINRFQQLLSEHGKARDTSTNNGLSNYKLDNYQLDVSISLLHEYIGFVEAMSFDATPSLTFIKSILPTRLEYLAGQLRLSNAKEVELKRSLTIDAENKELQSALALTKEKLQFDALSMQKTMLIASAYEFDITPYQSLLVKVTGELNSNVFDKEVVSTLLRDWWLGAKHDIRSNAINYLLKAILFVLIIIVFRFLANMVSRLILRSFKMNRVNVSVLMQDMLVSLVSRFILLLGILVALSHVGVSLGPVLAGLGVAGFIVGFALQDTLSNFASGMMILIYRPYDVGDVVEAGGAFGTVKKMNIVSTTILTFDNQTLIIPNSKIWGDVIKNVTAQYTRRIDMVFGVSYSEDIPKTETILQDIVSHHPKVLSDPEYKIKLHKLNDSSMDFIVRPWVRTTDYWDVYWDITREVKMRFDKEGITIPFPQRDIHIISPKQAEVPETSAEPSNNAVEGKTNDSKGDYPGESTPDNSSDSSGKST